MLPKARKLDSGFATVATVLFAGLTTWGISTLGFALDLAYKAQKIQLVADATALIASESAVGLIAGFGCENAEAFAGEFDLALDTCRIVGFGAKVSLSQTHLLYELSAAASASPE